MEISSGNVNLNLKTKKSYCFLKNIQWYDEIFNIDSGQEVRIQYNSDSFDCDKKEVAKCHSTCTKTTPIAQRLVDDYKRDRTVSMQGGHLLDRCWSDKQEHCQEFRITFCQQSCSNPKHSCYFRRDMSAYSKCCNDRCGAGCGVEGNTCTVCGESTDYGDFVNRLGVCEMKTSCKDLAQKNSPKSLNGKKYSSSQMLGNSGAKFNQYLRYCLEECPENYPSDGISCVKRCPRNHYVDEKHHACAPCKKGPVNDEIDWCYQEKGICRIDSGLDFSDDATTFKELMDLQENCKVIDGSLNFNLLSWQGIKNNTQLDHEKMTYRDIEDVRKIVDKLSSVEVITGFLAITIWPMDLKNFCAFQNLKLIKGRELYGSNYSSKLALFVANQRPNFNDLCFYKLAKIEHGGVFIHDLKESRQLFPGNFDQWNSVMKVGQSLRVNTKSGDFSMKIREINDANDGDMNRYLHHHKCDDSCDKKHGCFGYSGKKGKNMNKNCVRCAADYVTDIGSGSAVSSTNTRRIQTCKKFCDDNSHAQLENVDLHPVSGSYTRKICSNCDFQCGEGCESAEGTGCKGLYKYKYIPVDSETGLKIRNMSDFDGRVSYKFRSNYGERNEISSCKNAVRVLYPYTEENSAVACSNDCSGNFTNFHGQYSLESSVVLESGFSFVYFTDHSKQINESSPVFTKKSTKQCFQCHPRCIGKCHGITEETCSECSMKKYSFSEFQESNQVSQSMQSAINSQNSTKQLTKSDLSIVDIQGNGCLLYKNFEIPEIKYCFGKQKFDQATCSYGCQLLVNNLNSTIPDTCGSDTNCRSQKYTIVKCHQSRMAVSNKTTVLVAIFLLITFLPVICLVHMWYKARVKNLKNVVAGAVTGNQDLDKGTLLTQQFPTGQKPNRNTLRVVKESELQFSAKLGSGAFGDVYRALWCPSIVRGEKVKILVAVKVIKGKLTQEASKEMLDETKVMASIDSPWLVKLLGIAFGDKVMMISPLMPGGALNEFLKKEQSTITSHNMMTWCHQIAKGMKYLGEMNMVHRDLATRNVLVKTVDHVKITDFGLAKMLERNQGGTYKLAGGERMAIKWLAPECLRHKIFSSSSDVWAYGITVWEILTFGGRPWQDVKISSILEKLESGERLEQPSSASLDFWMFLVQCWMKQPESRIDFRGIVHQISQMASDSTRYITVIPQDPENCNNNRGYMSQSSAAGLIEKESWMNELGLDARDLATGNEGQTVQNDGVLLIDPSVGQIEEYLKPEDASGIQQAAYSGNSSNTNSMNNRSVVTPSNGFNSQPTMTNDVFESVSSRTSRPITNNSSINNTATTEKNSLYENTGRSKTV